LRRFSLARRRGWDPSIARPPYQGFVRPGLALRPQWAQLASGVCTGGSPRTHRTYLKVRAPEGRRSQRPQQVAAPSMLLRWQPPYTPHLFEGSCVGGSPFRAALWAVAPEHFAQEAPPYTPHLLRCLGAGGSPVAAAGIRRPRPSISLGRHPRTRPTYLEVLCVGSCSRQGRERSDSMSDGSCIHSVARAAGGIPVRKTPI